MSRATTAFPNAITIASAVPSFGRAVKTSKRGPVEAIENARAAKPRRAQLVAQAGPTRRRTPAGLAETASRVLRAAIAQRRLHAGVIRPPSSDDGSAPCGRQFLRARTSRPRDQSIARSCQKFVSCSAVHTASDARSSSASR